MIERSQLTEIGVFGKPHGVNGEITATIDSDVEVDELKCLFVDIDGIFVPFFINSFRRRGTEASLLIIDGFESADEVRVLTNKKIYCLTEELPLEDLTDEDGFYTADFIGWKIMDGKNLIGEITDFDDSTENVLFIVRTPADKTVYVPVADELITEIDEENRLLSMNLPDGLVDLS